MVIGRRRDAQSKGDRVGDPTPPVEAAGSDPSG